MQLNNNMLSNKLKEFIYYTAWGGMVFLVFYIVIGYLSYSGYSIGFNASESERTGFYYTTPNLLPLNNKSIYAFQLESNNTALGDGVVDKDTYLLKQVGAFSGEYLFTKSNTVYDCKADNYNKNCHMLGSCLSSNAQGKALACQQWDGYKIPANHYYMISKRVNDSYDSRYFGLINGSQIKRIAHLIGG